VAQVLEAVKDSAGIVSNVARKLGCDWHTARRYIDEYATAQAAFDGETQRVNDLAEVKLIEQIQAGEQWAVKYRLSCKARDRGYGEAVQVSGPGGKAVPVEVKHSIDANTAVTIFDILAQSGAIAAESDAASADEVHHAQADG